MRPGACGAALLALLACAAVTPALAGPRGSEFSPSIVLTLGNDIKNQCKGMVDRAAGLNARAIKFVPTVYYHGSETGINSYTYRMDWNDFRAPSAATIQEFQNSLAACMKHAVSKGLNIGVLAHLDNSAGYTWRNILEFSPLAKYGGYSYDDVVLTPIARALRQSIGPNTEVIFTLQGETGKSVSQYAKQWLQLVGSVKAEIRKAGKGRVLTGVSMNYNKVYGWIDFDSISPAAISRDFSREFAAQAKKYPLDLPNMKKLYDAIDVIGVSAYPPLSVNFKQSDLEITLKYHAQELSAANINLKQLLQKGKRLVISEWGVGGGTQDGNNIAASVSDVAGYPFFGLWYPFSQAKNPWKNQQYNNYRYKLYTATSKWLKSRGGPTYRVDGLYMWNAGSWDAMGVHFATPTPAVGSWADPNIITAVRQHNKAVN